MTIQEITDRNYLATVRRGLINKDTDFINFLEKIQEETYELEHSHFNYDQFNKSELADITLVCFSMAKHYGIDLIKVMEEKMLYNETRID